MARSWQSQMSANGDHGTSVRGLRINTVLVASWKPRTSQSNGVKRGGPLFGGVPPGKLFSPHYLFIYVLNSDDKAVHKHQMGPYFIYCEQDVGERQAASGRGFLLHRFILKHGSAVWWVARAADLFP